MDFFLINDYGKIFNTLDWDIKNEGIFEVFRGDIMRTVWLLWKVYIFI